MSTRADIVTEPAIGSRRTQLSAGPWTMLFEAGDLRYISWEGREAVRRVYGAVRDESWETVPAVVNSLDLRTLPSGFKTRYTAVHQGDRLLRAAGAIGGGLTCRRVGIGGSSLSTRETDETKAEVADRSSGKYTAKFLTPDWQSHQDVPIH